MQPYQNFYANQQPFMQQPIQNPYMDRMAQVQNMQMQQQRQFPTVIGRFVKSADEVTASDVSMDGSMNFFPKADMSEIYGKAWQPDGKIKTIVFKPVLEEQETNTNANMQNNENDAFFEFKEQIKEMLNGINDRFDNLEKSLKTKSTKTKSE